MREQIAQLDKIWGPTMTFTIEPDDKVEGFLLLKELDDIYTQLDESLAQINTILASRYVKPLRSEAEKWQKDILLLSDIIDEWVTCQRSWMYLRTIFKAQDIMK